MAFLVPYGLCEENVQPPAFIPLQDSVKHSVCSLQAFKVIREEKLSAALFAPGWVMETQGTEHFIANEDKYVRHFICWQLL